MMMDDSLTVLIVEDEPAITELLGHTMRSAGWKTAYASNAAQAWQFILEQRKPNLVLLDWGLPDQSGLSFLNRIRSDRELGSIAVIMLTARAMEEDKIVGLNNGADDYITKPFSPRELIARVTAVLRRKYPEFGQTPIAQGNITLDPNNCVVCVDDRKIDIGHAEYKLLKFFLSHPERVFTRQQLLNRVWGDRAVIEERTVDVHILRLRKALRTAENMVKTMRGMGYMFSTK